MKNLLAALLFATVPVLASSQAPNWSANHTILCNEPAVVFKELQEKYKEVPIWTGPSTSHPGVTATVLANPDGESWTIVLFSEKAACVVTIGEKSQFKFPKGKSST